MVALRRFRFLHASDFHLDQPLHGLAKIPEAARDLFVDAPLKSSARVFQAAVKNKVDFLVLSGDLLDLRQAGAREIDFLQDQFQQLTDKKIPVYWIPSEADCAELWPGSVPLPDFVHVYSGRKPRHFVCQVKNEPIAEIVAWSGQGETSIIQRKGRDDLFRIAALHIPRFPESLSEQSIDYWALGGHHQRMPVEHTFGQALYSGSPQGRNPREQGVHGCTLVQVETNGQLDTSFLATDVVRWHEERIQLSDDATRADLESILGDRLQDLVEKKSDTKLLVSWVVVCNGAVGVSLRQGGLADELLRTLVDDQSDTGVWSVSFTAELGALPPELFREDTILGDYLRTIRGFETEHDGQLDLRQFVEGCSLDDEFMALLCVTDPQQRRHVLREAAILGVDLLSGQHELSTSNSS